MKKLNIFLLLAFLTSSLYAQQPQLWLEGEGSIETIIEDSFEDMTLPPFTTSGVPWTVNNSDASAGIFSAESGQNTGFAASVIQLTVTVPAFTTAVLTFEAKRISPGGFDRFFINDIEILTFDGIGQWESYKFELSSGVNFLRWNHGSFGYIRLDNVRVATKDHGIVRIQDGNEGIGKKLISDEFGNARWQETPQIGDLAHGGIVFYVNNEGTHGLVAANQDQRASGNWYEAVSTVSPSPNDYYDWRLPLDWELYQMWRNLHRNGCPPDDTPCSTSLGDFTSDTYWSSSQGSAVAAWYVNFNDGTGDLEEKTELYRSRAVRAF